MHLKIILLMLTISFSLFARISYWQKQNYKLNIISAAQTIPQYGCSSYFEVQSRTPNNASYNQVTNLTVNLTSIANVKFFSDPSCSIEITSLTIPVGSNSAVAYFSATLTGSFSLQASTLNYSEASQSQTINANNFFWTGNAGDTLWSNPTNWSNNAVPNSSHIAIFDNSCINCNVTIDTNINVAGIKIDSNYIGTITQDAANTITMGTRHFIMRNGVFIGSVGNIIIDSTFFLHGGNFTSTSGILSAKARHMNYSGYFSASSVFNHNTGTVRLQNSLSGSTAHTLSYFSNQEFNNVEFTGGATIFNTGTMTVNGLLKVDLYPFASSIIDGTFNLKGDIEIVNYEDYTIASSNPNLVTWVINGIGNQTITTNAGEDHLGSRAPRITINKPSGTLNVTGSLSSRELKILSGTLTMSSGMFLVLKNATSAPITHYLNGGTFPNISFLGAKPQILGDNATCDNLKIDVRGNFARVSGGTLYVKENVTVIDDENSSGQSNLRVELIGAVSSNISVATSPSGLRLPGTLVVNKSTQATAVNLLSNVLINGNSSDLILQSGIVNMSGFNLTIGSASGTDNQLTLESGTTINRSGGTLTYEAITNNGGTINP